jgi:hypothetical protein
MRKTCRFGGTEPTGASLETALLDSRGAGLLASRVSGCLAQGRCPKPTEGR